MLIYSDSRSVLKQIERDSGDVGVLSGVAIDPPRLPVSNRIGLVQVKMSNCTILAWQI